MGEKKRIRTLIWKQQQLNNSVDELLKEMREKEKSSKPLAEEEGEEGKNGEKQ